jgi:phytol kinase
VTTADTWLSAAVPLVLFLALLGVAEWWARSADVPSEWPRKLVHLTGGLIGLTFPWFVTSPWIVLVFALGLSSLFLLGARGRFLRCLHSVTRRTLGSEYYPLAVFLVFLMAGDEPWRYVASILTLALADAFAALIGSHYGRIRYVVEDSKKSLEGSMVFLVIAFLTIHLPLLLMSDLPRETAVLAALLVALLVTGFEAVSLEGSDNLFVPVGVCALLGKITAQPIEEIIFQNVSFLVLITVMGGIMWRTRAFPLSAGLMAILFTYGAWSLGSPAWALPALVVFLLYAAAWIWIKPADGARPSFRVRIMFRVLAIPLVILIFANVFHWEDLLFLPFVASLSAVATMSLTQHLLIHRPIDAAWPRRARSLGMCFAAAAVICLPAVWLIPALPAAGVIAALIVTALCGPILDLLTNGRPPDEVTRLWTARHIFLTALAAGITAVFSA